MTRSTRIAVLATGALSIWCADAAAGGAGGASGLAANLPRFFGRLHPLLVHFPIALLMAGLLFELAAIVIRRERTRPSSAGLACVGIGAVGAVAAAGAGWLNADLETHGRGVAGLMETHRWLGIGATALALAALVGGAIGAAARSRAMTGVYRVALVLAAGLVGAAGHWGGSMVHGEGYLTAALFPEPAPPRPDPERAEAAAAAAAGLTLTVDFATQVRPILEHSCIDCHGPSRSRGNLRLDSAFHAIESRDAQEAVIVPGDAAASELFYRVTLPHDDPDLMPPEGDGAPLTSEEIALLETWINEGAHWIETPVVARQEAPAPESPRAPEPLRFDEAARAERDAALAAVRERGGVAQPVAVGEPWAEVRLDLLGSEVTDDDIALLEPLAPTLVSLNLAGTGVTDAGVEALGAFARLRRLHLERTAVTDAGVAHLAEHPSLEYLNLYGTGVTDRSLVVAASMPALRRLYVWQTGASPEAASLLSALRPGLVVDAGASAAEVVFDDGPAEGESVSEAAAPEAEPSPGAEAGAPTAPCCLAAAERGELCDHACCVSARAEGVACPTCTP